MANKKTVEGWCEEQKVASIMANWRHITTGHVKDANGKVPAGKSYFTGECMTIVGQINDTISSRQKRVLYQAGSSSKATVVRNFAPTVVGKDGATGNDCTYVVVVLGLATSGRENGKPIIYTSFPGSNSYVQGLAPLG